MIKAALVSYLNTKPFIQGLEEAFLPDELSLQLLTPAQCARALAAKEVSLALVPVGALADLPGVHLMKDHCIGARGKVESVFLLSHTPVERIRSVVKDEDSRTSNLLAALLFRNHWQQEVNFKDAPRGLVPTTEATYEGLAWVQIGDKAMKLKDSFPVVIDLAAEWQRYSGLPFVFAVWAYYADAVSPAMLDRLRLAMQRGTSRLKEAAQRYGPAFDLSPEQALHYYQNCICYQFDSLMHEGFERFVKEALEMPQ